MRLFKVGDKDLLTTSTMVVVEHGANANVARPADAVAVYWKGTVEPVNALDGDLWVGGA